MKQDLIYTTCYSSVAFTEQEVVSDHIKKCKELKAEVKITQHKPPTMYWIPWLHKNPYKARFISRSCTSTNINWHERETQQ